MSHLPSLKHVRLEHCAFDSETFTQLKSRDFELSLSTMHIHECNPSFRPESAIWLALLNPMSLCSLWAPTLTMANMAEFRDLPIFPRIHTLEIWLRTELAPYLPILRKFTSVQTLTLNAWITPPPYPLEGWDELFPALRNLTTSARMVQFLAPRPQLTRLTIHETRWESRSVPVPEFLPSSTSIMCLELSCHALDTRDFKTITKRMPNLVELKLLVSSLKPDPDDEDAPPVVSWFPNGPALVLNVRLRNPGSSSHRLQIVLCTYPPSNSSPFAGGSVGSTSLDGHFHPPRITDRSRQNPRRCMSRSILKRSSRLCGRAAQHSRRFGWTAIDTFSAGEYRPMMGGKISSSSAAG
jgi:hypothetical protein